MKPFRIRFFEKPATCRRTIEINRRAVQLRHLHLRDAFGRAGNDRYGLSHLLQQCDHRCGVIIGMRMTIPLCSKIMLLIDGPERYRVQLKLALDDTVTGGLEPETVYRAF